jgi:hypothetical protein
MIHREQLIVFSVAVALLPAIAALVAPAAPGNPPAPTGAQKTAQAPVNHHEPSQVQSSSPASPPATRQIGRKPELTPAQRDEDFKKRFAKVRMSGHFTLDGQENDRFQKEEYVVTGATKLGDGDLWAITARIKFNDVDVAVPVPVQVKWAGDTPVIVLDKVSIPGLGTFSARVVLDESRYAGTWSHDEKGGHMFGTIMPAGDEPAETQSTETPSP